jgi:hypothetical protein
VLLEPRAAAHPRISRQSASFEVTLTMAMNRKLVPVFGSAGMALAALALWWLVPVASATEITVYKSPSCGCCSKWEDHLRANGFDVVSKHVEDVAPVKAWLGVPSGLEACHTAEVDGYVVEGHVPADLIKRLLQERPRVMGLAVPGMPQGSPGMEQGYKEPYDILTFDAEGNTAVYARR